VTPPPPPVPTIAADTSATLDPGFATVTIIDNSNAPPPPEPF
jgi:hypothetical protein